VFGVCECFVRSVGTNTQEKKPERYIKNLFSVIKDPDIQASLKNKGITAAVLGFMAETARPKSSDY